MWEQCWLGDTPWRRPLLFWPRRSDLAWRCAQLKGLHSGGNERGQDKWGWQHWPGKHLGMVWTVRGTSKYSGECKILDQLFSNSAFLGLAWRVCYANILLDPTAIDSKSGGLWTIEKQLQISEGCKNWRRKKKDKNIVWCAQIQPPSHCQNNESLALSGSLCLYVRERHYKAKWKFMDRAVYLWLSLYEQRCCEQDLNLHGETPLGFESNILTTQSSQLQWLSA